MDESMNLQGRYRAARAAKKPHSLLGNMTPLESVYYLGGTFLKVTRLAIINL